MTDRTSHDKLWKTVFGVFLKDLVELVQPELAEQLDLDHAELVPPELFADFRKEGHVTPDLVAKARARNGEPRLIFVHVDVESRFRRIVDERMWRYAMHLRLKLKRPVITLVVFLRGGAAGVQAREVVESVGSFEVNRFRYLAFGLSQSLARSMSTVPSLWRQHSRL